MALSAGSIAFTGFNADGSDNLAFVALEEIPAGTVIYFRDDEWDGAAFNTGEGAFAFTATVAIAAGTIVRIDMVSAPAGAQPTTNLGTVAYVLGTNRGYSNDGDTVYAYLGTDANTPTVFLTAVASNGFGAATGVLTGTGLTAGQTALELTGGVDIASYEGARNNQTTLAAYRDVLNTASNYTTQNGGGDQSDDGIAPDAPFSTAAFTTGGPTQTVRFAAGSVTVAKPEGDAGETIFTFTVERAGGTTGAVEFVGRVLADEAEGDDFTAGVQFFPFGGRFEAGSASTTVSVAVKGDLVIEATERFQLLIEGASNDANVPISIDADRDQATGVIQTDDAGRTVGGIVVYDAAPSLQGSADVPTGSGAINLVRLGSIAGTGADPESRAEVVVFDPASDRLYVVNAAADRIDIVLVGADGGLTASGGIALAGLPNYGAVNSVAVKNGIVAVAYAAPAGDQPGRVALFDTATNTLQSTVQVGVLPDQLTFTPDGSKILVANEAEAVSAANNPAGSISILDLSGGAAGATVINTISFASLNGEEIVLRERGLALFPGQSAAADIEPEYISVSPDGARAYVTLQEVNAVAVIDLTDADADRPLSIQPLGAVDRSLAGNPFDPSDRNGIALANFDVDSLSQPDSIASFSVGGFTYFVTANEGDARVGLSDELRLSSAAYVLDPTAYPNAAELKADGQLGRLNVLRHVGDTDGDGDIDQITTFGGRGISIFRQNADGSFTKVRETGGEFERIIAAQFPSLHNTEDGEAPDTRSDNKGPEPEGVTIGVVNGRTYAFVALERVGGVMVYDVTDPANARFVVYRPATEADYAPETVLFISAADSPTGQALLVTANEGSGTTTLYAVQSRTRDDDVLTGDGGANSLGGLAGDDRLSGMGGDDTLLGGNDDDRLDGGDGDDRLVGGAGQDDVQGGDGADTANGEGRDTLDGGAGADVLIGDGGDDSLLGGAQGDSLQGGVGDDTLQGGGGRDVLFGGAGADRFRYVDAADSGAGGTDVVKDFGPDDLIDLSALDADGDSANGDTAFSFIGGARFSKVAGQVRAITNDLGNTQVFADIDGDGTADLAIRLVGAGPVTADDFLL